MSTGKPLEFHQGTVGNEGDSVTNSNSEISPAAATALLLVEKFGAAVVLTHGVDDSGRCLCRDGIDCGTPGKHPIGRGGYLNATTTIGAITSASPSCNWSLRTVDGLGALDDDTPDQSGMAAVEDSIGHKLPDTATIRTAKDHLTKIFSASQGLPRVIGLLKTLAGNLDFIGDPGMVVIPGSRSRNDRGGVAAYSWEASPNDVGIAALPAGVAQIVRFRTQNHKQGGVVTQRKNNSCVTGSFCVTDTDRLIQRCVPDMPGMRWHSLFRLARERQGVATVRRGVARTIGATAAGLVSAVFAIHPYKGHQSKSA